MLRVLLKNSATLTLVEALDGWLLPADAVWIDLLSPTREEELALEAQLGAQVPTRDEMAEIEASSRLYREEGGLFMTAQIVAHSDTDNPQIGPVTFVLAGERLVTIRYIEPGSFKVFEAGLHSHPYESGAAAFLGLVDEVIDRLADVVEKVVAESEALGTEIFSRPTGLNFRKVVTQLGRSQRMSAKVRESAASLSRLLIFASGSAPVMGSPGCQEKLETLRQDLASVTDYASYLSANITFLLDAALGMINIEQNSIIKFFSVAAVIFLPPTLVASYFGMNFRHMREFGWQFGEAVALALMIVSIVIPMLWFKKKGWL